MVVLSLRLAIVACAFAHADGLPAFTDPDGFMARSVHSLLAVSPSDTKATACSKCGFNDKGAGNCCSNGGAWSGTCKVEGGDHTFVEGFDACKGANEMAAPLDVVVSEHGSEQTMPSLYAGAFEADKPAAPADEKKHQFDTTSSTPDAQQAAPADAQQAAPAETPQAASAEALQVAPAEAQPKLPSLQELPADAQQAAPAVAQPKLPSLQDLPADAQQAAPAVAQQAAPADTQQAAPAQAQQAAPAQAQQAAPANADAVSAAEDAYMKGLKEAPVDSQEILDDPDAEGRRKQKAAEAKAEAIASGQQAKPAAEGGPMTEASQKVIDDYNDAWKDHNEKQERTKCQAPDGTPLPCEQVLTNAEEILDKANKEAEAFEKEAQALPQGDPTSPDYKLPLADNGFVPEAVSGDYDQSEAFFFPPPPASPPVLEVPDDDEDEEEEKQEFSFKDFLKVKKAKDTFEQGDESTWYKDPPPDQEQEKAKSDFGKSAGSPFEEFNNMKGQDSSQQHEGLLRSATSQESQAADSGPSFGQQAAEARRNSESGGFSGSLRPPDARPAPVATQELVVPY